MKLSDLFRLPGRARRLVPVAAMGLTLGVSACATVGEPAYPQEPALWVIRDQDSSIYLFGTIHVLRPETVWFTPRVQAAFDASDELWLEVTNPDDQAAAAPLIQQHGLSLDRPLSQRLGAADFARLDAAARTLGLTGAQMEPLRPWLAAVTLAMAPLLKAGYDPTSGADVVLRGRAREADKPIRGLETLEQQIGFMAGFSEDAQLAFLRSALDAFEQAETQIDGLAGAWASGDVAAIQRLAVDELRESGPEVYDIMLTRRNADWANQIQTLLSGSGTAFIAVGAAHLAGDDSVQAMLQRRGVRVERVR